MALDLERPLAREALRRLVASADVLVENARPGTMERRGLGYGDLSRINPGLVWCSLATFGERGSYAGRGAHDLQVVGLTGLLHGSGDPGRPVRPRLAVVPPVTALAAATGILAALDQRHRTGKGAQVEASMLGSALWLMADLVPAAGPDRDPLHAQLAGNDVYECADGQFLTVSAVGARPWRALLAVLGLDLGPEPRTAEEQQRYRDTLAAAFLRCARSEWLPKLEAAGVPAGPVLSLSEAVVDAGVRDSGALTDIGGATVVAPPVRVRSTGDAPPGPGFRAESPKIGQHTREVLCEAGLADVEIDELLTGMP